MEALAALSVACNVFQVVSFTHETVTLLKTLRAAGTPDPGLANHARRLQELSSQLQTSLQNASTLLHRNGGGGAGGAGGGGESSDSRNTPETSLDALAQRCIEVAAQIQTEMDKITSSRYSATRLARALRARRRLDALDVEMHGCQQTLHTGLLAKLWNQQTSAALQQRSDLVWLDQRLKDCLARAENLFQHDNVSLLASLTTHEDTVRQLIAASTADLHSHIHAVQASLVQHQADKEQLSRLYDSLWFDGINSRRTQIERSYKHTFGWVFGPVQKSRQLDDESSDEWSAEFDEPGSSDEWPAEFDEPGEAEESETSNKGTQYGPLRTWLVNGKDLFWVNGKAGSGKSCFMKFLVQDERTAALLPGYAIYSYFIWNAGTLMQRNRKGMLCSLVHQMLVKNPGFASQLLRDHPELNQRKAPSDWELNELENTLQNVLKMHHEPVCLFIDGLDELDRKDDNFGLRKLLLETLAAAPTLKICVSSRPEPLWVALMKGYPTMKLQDLTHRDHMIVAKNLLTDYYQVLFQGQKEEDIQKLVHQLVDKADGVFLWLRLALKSLQRGLTSQDNLEELSERIDALPNELISLYQSMWDRLGDDKKMGRQEAAMYFQIVLLWTIPGRLTSTTLTLACTPSLDDKMCQDPEGFKINGEFLDACQHTQKRVEYRCAGLLEFKANFQSTLGGLEVLFIHRSARDFLLDTSEGRQLLEGYSPQLAVQRIIQSSVCLTGEGQCTRKTLELWESDFRRILNFSPHLQLERHVLIDNTLEYLRGNQAIFASGVPETWADIIFDLVKYKFKKLSLATFYETIAASGILALIRRLPIFDSDFLPNNPLLGYLWHWYLSGDPVYPEITQWWLDHGASIHGSGGLRSYRLILQTLPRLQSIREQVIYEALSPDASPDPNLLKLVGSSPDKENILWVYRLNYSSLYHYDLSDNMSPFESLGGWGLVTVRNPQVPAIDIVLKINMQQLFNNVYWIGSTRTAADSVRKEWQDALEKMLYPQEVCRCEVALVGRFFASQANARGPGLERIFKEGVDPSPNPDSSFFIKSKVARKLAMDTGQDSDDFTPSNGRYCVPTRVQSDRILEFLKPASRTKIIENAYDLDDTVANSLRGLLNEVIATSDNYVTDIAKHFRQIGIHILKEDDFRELQQAHGAFARSAILARVHEDKLKVERLWEERQQSKEG